MGIAKQREIELNQLNIGKVKDKHFCVRHFEDNAIKRFIRQNYSIGYCDYCDKEVKVISLEVLLRFMMIGIGNFYEDAANFMGHDSREGGYLGETFDTSDLILEKVGLLTDPFDLTLDIIDSIEEIAWAKPNQHYDSARDELMYVWGYFKNLIKHKTRFLFNEKNSSRENANGILKELGKIVIKFGLIKKIEKGKTIYRCRQHTIHDAITQIDRLVAPPVDKAIYANRFSPSGVSMLYAALDPRTAVLETLSRENRKKNRITISNFKLSREIYIIDFTSLPNIPSIFDYKKKKHYYLLIFLYDLVRDFTQDITKDGREHIDYVPTQVVTEYFRYPFNKNRKKTIEGIIYPSSKNEKNPSCVFFWDNEECIQNLSLENTKVEKIKSYI